MGHQNIWKLPEHERYRQKRRAQATAFYLNPQAADIIIDIGCGEGFLTKHFTGSGFVVGIDLSKNFLIIAKQKVKLENVEFVCADATALPIRNTSVDKATALEVLEHLTKDDQQKLIREADRVLKEKGTLIISVPYREQITYTRCVHCGKLTPLWGHLDSFDKEKVNSLLPNHYTLVASCHLPNVGLISLASTLEHLPFRLWFILNNLLAKVRKGYWILLKYEKG